MSANLEGGPRGSSSSGRSLGVAIAACLSAIVLAGVLAVTIFTGDSGDAKADKRPERVKVDTKQAKDNDKADDAKPGDKVEPAQPTPQPQVPVGPIDPYGDTYVDPYDTYGQCDPYLDPTCTGDSYDSADDYWLLPDTSGIDPWSSDTELDETYGAAF
jgi:hypothetical protein